MAERIKAAKEHTCFWCSTAINKGSMYIQAAERIRSGFYPDRIRFHEECYPVWLTAGRPTTQQDQPKPVKENGWTVLVRRNTVLRSMRYNNSSVNSTIFVCRVEAQDSREAVTLACKQAHAYDMQEWNSDAKHLFMRQPRPDLYSAISCSPGYPSIIRPE